LIKTAKFQAWNEHFKTLSLSLSDLKKLHKIFSRVDFEKTFNVNFEEMKNKMNLAQESSSSDIDKIIEENEFKFDVDSILDKISKFGIENLSPEEKNFLDNLNK
jgi:hypothetical protein